MEEAGEDYYDKILYKGQKRLGPKTKSGGSKDQAPRVRLKVVRKVNGVPTNQDVVTQIGFNENLEETRELQTMSTSGGRRKLTPITPIEKDEVNKGPLNINSTEDEQAANTQRAAIAHRMKEENERK